MKTFSIFMFLVVMTMLTACTLKKAPLPEPVYKTPSGPPAPDPKQIEEARKKEEARKAEAAAKKAAEVRRKAKRTVKYVAPVIKRMKVIGQKEYVYLRDAEMKLSARIDTGAKTSSLHATDIQRYERDGKNWVRFTLTDPEAKRTVELERPLVRRVRIKEHNGDDQRRYIVELRITLGTIKCRTEFSLVDRGHFEFPVLIGRSFLHGKAVVDVTKEYTTSPLNDTHEQ